MAFQLPCGEELAKRWAQIPDDTDVLITHGPPLGIGDCTGGRRHGGDDELLARVLKLSPALHIFGHIHEGRGVYSCSDNDTTFINAATTGRAATAPIVLDIPLPKQQSQKAEEKEAEAIAPQPVELLPSRKIAHHADTLQQFRLSAPPPPAPREGDGARVFKERDQGLATALRQLSVG